MEASISYILPLEGVFFVRLFQILEDISSYSLTAYYSNQQEIRKPSLRNCPALLGCESLQYIIQSFHP